MAQIKLVDEEDPLDQRDILNASSEIASPVAQPLGLRVDRNMKNDSNEIFRPNYAVSLDTTTQPDSEATAVSSVRKLRVRYIDRQQKKALAS